MIPILDSSKTQTAEDLSERRQRLYHACVKILAQKLQEFCSKDHDFLYAERIRKTRPFMHFFLMDGLEISMSTQCPTSSCHACWCPDDELDNTEVK